MRNHLLESYITQYDKAGRNSKRRHGEIQNYLNFISTEYFDRFDYDTVQLWIKKRKKSLCNRAIAGAQNHISDFASWARLFDETIGEIPKYGRIQIDRRKPVILDESQISHIMLMQKSQKTQSNINPKTYSTITGLLYVTGLRIGEALNLSDHDVDFADRTMYVQSGKGERDRLVPISTSTVDVLNEYIDWRDNIRTKSSRLFIFDKKDIKHPNSKYRKNFNKVAETMGLRDPNSKGHHRSNLVVHDLRHSYAVNALVKAYESNADMNEAIVQLSSILGHEKLEETYWYIEGVPELVSAAFERVAS